MTTAHLLLRYVHISMGVVALLAGAAAMTFRKGGRRHRQAGIVFFVSMLILASVGGFIAYFLNPNMGNVMGSLLALYFVISGWSAAWRAPNRTGKLEIGAALLGAAAATLGIVWGVEAASRQPHRLDGYPPLFYYIFGGAALLGTLLDLRMIVRGGFTGTQRTARHLSRMMIAMFMATASFFLGQAKHFPAAVRESRVHLIPVILVIGALLYWLVRVRLRPWLRKDHTLRPIGGQT
jgi:uncharacterized membrane protein YfcA